MNYKATAEHVANWLRDYATNAKVAGFVVGVSGGVDSAVVSTLCAMTGLPTTVVTMGIHQTRAENDRADEHIQNLMGKFPNVQYKDVNLTETFDVLRETLAEDTDDLGLVNSRSRLRMIALYAIANAQKALVVGTGNKVEDFGIGFFTKYGDGGVDISPIGELMKSDVYALAKEIGVVDSILAAKPTDGLWTDGRTDEDQIGATYAELEWAMQIFAQYRPDAANSVLADFSGALHNDFTPRQLEVLKIYLARHNANAHKMAPIPICTIPQELQ